MSAEIIANGNKITTDLPCSIYEFLERLNLMPKSGVVELNQEAVSPSQFIDIQLKDGDKMEIVKIVAGG